MARTLAWTAALLLSVPSVAPSVAHAWTDARPAGLVTEVVVDRDGAATVTLRVRWRIAAGRFHTFDLTEVPPDAVLVEATATDGQGAPVAISAQTPAPGRLEVTLGEREGVRRGNVDVVLRYTSSLRAQNAIHRAGNDAVIDVAMLPWERGVEAAELRVATPTSIQRARWLADETPGVESSVSNELGRDMVRVVRRHLPAATRWSARIACDRALFPWLEAPIAAAPTVASTRYLRWQLPTAMALLALLLGGVTEILRRTHARRPRLLPLPKALRWAPTVTAALAGVLLAHAVDALRGALTLGTALAVLAVLSATAAPAPLAPFAHGRLRRVTKPTALAVVPRVRLPWALLGLALATCARGFGLRSAVASMVGAALGVAGLALLMARRESASVSEPEVLHEVEKSLQIREEKSRFRAEWRQRGERDEAPGAWALRLVAKSGYRLQNGLIALEWRVAHVPSALRWMARPTLVVRARMGSRIERDLRLAALRVGRLVVSTDGRTLAWCAPWFGVARGLARAQLGVMVAKGFGRTSERKALATQPDEAEALVFSERAEADRLDAVT
ncbi:MAG: hypothetical protein Q8Q09_14480 [Deltaproteobacteria bacterium]|nr:hypothetical protein [Deltaproteobacteria bacterium]